MVLFISELFTNKYKRLCPMSRKSMRFEELKKLVATKNFNSMSEYRKWVRSVNSPEIPLHPHSAYINKGWTGSSDFLSKQENITKQIQSIQGRRGALIQHYGKDAVNNTITVTESNTQPVKTVSIQPVEIELDYRDKCNALYVLAKSGYTLDNMDSLIERIDWSIGDAKKMAKDLLAIRLGLLVK